VILQDVCEKVPGMFGTYRTDGVCDASSGQRVSCHVLCVCGVRSSTHERQRVRHQTGTAVLSPGLREGGGDAAGVRPR
jgi:hypothetical protein